MPLQNLGYPLLLSLLAGLSTGIGGLIALCIRDYKKSHLCFSLGLSAGVMIYISLVELLPEAIGNIGGISANIGFFIGIFFIALLDYAIPHNYIQEEAHQNSSKQSNLSRTGLLTALGIAIHNLPEGLLVLGAALANPRLGITLALAIALHNIPEGISISIPIYYATKSRAKAFFYSLLSGLAEPLGALIGGLLLYQYLNQTVVGYLLSFAAGVMVFISFDELLPTSFAQGRRHICLTGLLLGMAIIALSLYFIKANT